MSEWYIEIFETDTITGPSSFGSALEVSKQGYYYLPISGTDCVLIFVNKTFVKFAKFFPAK